MEVSRVGGSLGACISGIQLGAGFDGDVAEALRVALDEHLVVYLPGQDLSLDRLEALTDELGGRDVTPYVEALEDRPYVIKVIKERGDVLNFANAWHTDLSYLATPPRYTLLHAYETPPAGGDTIWANQQAAYAMLSPGLKSVLGGLDAVHSAGTAYGTGGLLDRYGKLSSMAIRPSADAYATETHPVVTRHPRTGRPSLFVNAVYTVQIDGWSAAESAGLLSYLYQHSTNENFTFRLHWEPGMLAIWDNRATQHFAVNDYPGERREMYRTSVRGERPERFV
jgi:taurine dioxygenase